VRAVSPILLDGTARMNRLYPAETQVGRQVARYNTNRGAK
jgi:hypothetical protein